MTNLSTIDAHDKLVLYFEDESRDTYCYILYDFTEREYFICGARGNQRGCPFNFYCKSKKTLLKYLKFIFEVTQLTYGLYNFSNIFGETDYVDLDILENKRSIQTEITAYVGATFNSELVLNLLKMLKEIRY